MASYVTTTEFANAMTGAQFTNLPAGELQSYINRASAGIEQYCHRVFTANASTVETLWSSGPGARVKIGNNGFVSLYPMRFYPINSVASVTWLLRQPALPPAGTQLGVTTTVLTADILVEPDQWNEGWRVRVFEDFGQYRDPGITMQWTITYNGGYTTYPDWLQQAAIDWTAGLLKRRGAQASVIAGSGQVVDMSMVGANVTTAKEILEPHVRRF